MMRKSEPSYLELTIAALPGHRVTGAFGKSLTSEPVLHNAIFTRRFDPIAKS